MIGVLVAGGRKLRRSREYSSCTNTAVLTLRVKERVELKHWINTRMPWNNRTFRQFFIHFISSVTTRCLIKCNCVVFRYERLSATQLMSRYPQWCVDDSTVALYQKDGGLVDAALANSTHVQLAQARGADVIEECNVISLKPSGVDECMVSRVNSVSNK